MSQKTILKIELLNSTETEEGENTRVEGELSVQVEGNARTLTDIITSAMESDEEIAMLLKMCVLKHTMETMGDEDSDLPF